MPLDMVNLSHAKKAQALASDLDYRKKLHDYTVMPDDMKVQQAKKAYQLQSDVRRRNMSISMASVKWYTHTVHYAFYMDIDLAILEPVPIRPDLDERSRMGGWWLPGCRTSQESRRTSQWGWSLQICDSLLIRLAYLVARILIGFLISFTTKIYLVFTRKTVLDFTFIHLADALFYCAFSTFIQKKYRQKVDSVKFTQVADTPSIMHAKKSQELQSGVRYDPSDWIFLSSVDISGINWPFLVLSWCTKRALNRQCTSTLWTKMSLSSSKPKLMQSFSVRYELNHLSLLLMLHQ